MSEPKCVLCFRREGCALLPMAARARPWIELVLGRGTNDWDRMHVIRRSLRGSGCSPGFVEDWISAGALVRDDVEKLVLCLCGSDSVELATLCSSCRLFLGPAKDKTDDRPDAA